MYKLLLLALSLSLATPYVRAQAPKIEKSVAFDEPDDGWNKVLQMKNGNTLFLHFTKKEGIEVVVYDKSRKQVSDKTITSELWEPRKMKETGIIGLYEINNEAVMFMVQAEGRTPTLYRLRIDGNTGAKVHEDEIGELPKQPIFMRGTGNSDIYVEKDENSDCYAVIFFNGFARERDERIKVQHYNGSHKLINIAYYESPEESYKYLRMIGAVVDGDKRVFLTVYGAASLKGRDAHVYISRLRSQDSVFTNKTLDFTEDFKDTRSVMAYCRANNTLRLLTMSYTTGKASAFTSSRRNFYLSFLSYIDPEGLELKRVIPIAGEKIDEYTTNVLKAKHPYRGLPQDMIINKDNSTTILSEEQLQQVIYDAKTGAVLKASTFLGPIGVSELDADGNEKSGFAILKNQEAGGLYEPLYIFGRRKGRWHFVKGGVSEHNSFLSYDYVSTENNRYIIFNDDPRNFERDEDERHKAVGKVDKLNTICYQLNGSTVNKSFLFGAPDDKGHSNNSYISASDYQKETSTYATILVERDGRDYQCRLVWVTFN